MKPVRTWDEVAAYQREGKIVAVVSLHPVDLDAARAAGVQVKDLLVGWPSTDSQHAEMVRGMGLSGAVDYLGVEGPVVSPPDAAVEAALKDAHYECRPCGLNADWATRAWKVGASTLVDLEGRWMVVEDADPEGGGHHSDLSAAIRALQRIDAHVPSASDDDRDPDDDRDLVVAQEDA